jgi:hypothetical protein
MTDSEEQKENGRSVTAILVLIPLVIMMSVLFVYQAGKEKTIQDSVPVPTIPSNNPTQPAVFNTPATIGDRTTTQGCFIQCPRCSTKGIPVCSSCGAVMQIIDLAHSTYVCPSCGRIGVPICPRCCEHMVSLGSRAGGSPTLAAAT